MARFRHIDFPAVLYETLRSYYSVNKQGQPSWLYKYCAALVQPLQGAWSQYETARAKAGLLASAKFQIGQLAAVLNYLYDAVLQRIYITQGFFNPTVATSTQDIPILFATSTQDVPTCFAVSTADGIPFTGAVIHVPVSLPLSQVTASVAQLAIPGLEYEIVTFTP
jgi:hypothetical protein